MQARFFFILCFLFITISFVKSQNLEYKDFQIQENHIKQVVEFIIRGDSSRRDTTINRRITFDTLGRLIKLEEHFNLRNENYITTTYTYTEQRMGYKTISTTTEKKVTIEEAIDGTRLRLLGLTNVLYRYSKNHQLMSIENTDGHYKETTRFTYNDKGLVSSREQLEDQEDYVGNVLHTTPDVFIEKIIVSYITYK